MATEKASEAAAEWADTKDALEAAYKMLDEARDREDNDRVGQDKLIDTVRMQAGALSRLTADKSMFRKTLEYVVLLVILALAADLLYLGRQLQLLLH